MSSGKIKQQRYKADGSKEGEERETGSAASDFRSPTITGLADGGWLISYLASVSGRTFVYQMRYNADGISYDLSTGIVQVVTADIDPPSVTALPEPDGGWVVVWEDSNVIWQKVYKADGTTRHEGPAAAWYDGQDPENPNVTTLSDGGWIMTWQLKLADGSFDIYQQAYNANATKRGTQTVVNTTLSGDQLDANVTPLSDGGWIVTWGSKDASGNASILQQAFNADGSKRGDEILVNTSSHANQGTPEVTALAGGGWIVTWVSYSDASSDRIIFHQAFNADGSKAGPERNRLTRRDLGGHMDASRRHHATAIPPQQRSHGCPHRWR